MLSAGIIASISALTAIDGGISATPSSSWQLPGVALALTALGLLLRRQQRAVWYLLWFLAGAGICVAIFVPVNALLLSAALIVVLPLPSTRMRMAQRRWMDKVPANDHSSGGPKASASGLRG